MILIASNYCLFIVFRIFGIIVKSRLAKDSNECHLFVELDPDQPAIAVVDFVNRYLIPSKQAAAMPKHPQ